MAFGGDIFVRMSFRAGLWLLLTIAFAIAAFGAGQTESSDLPEGAGKKIIETACTTCHDLGEVRKFKGYYSKDDWRDIVTTMVRYGAQVKDDEIPVLVDYLAKVFPKT